MSDETKETCGEEAREPAKTAEQLRREFAQLVAGYNLMEAGSQHHCLCLLFDKVEDIADAARAEGEAAGRARYGDAPKFTATFQVGNVSQTVSAETDSLKTFLREVGFDTDKTAGVVGAAHAHKGAESSGRAITLCGPNASILKLLANELDNQHRVIKQVRYGDARTHVATVITCMASDAPPITPRPPEEGTVNFAEAYEASMSPTSDPASASRTAFKLGWFASAEAILRGTWRGGGGKTVFESFPELGAKEDTGRQMVSLWAYNRRGDAMFGALSDLDGANATISQLRSELETIKGELQLAEDTIELRQRDISNLRRTIASQAESLHKVGEWVREARVLLEFVKFENTGGPTQVIWVHAGYRATSMEKYEPFAIDAIGWTKQVKEFLSK